MSRFKDNSNDYEVGSLDYDYGYHSGNDRTDRHSGYGSHSGSGYGKEECCPLVVDALCLAAILGAIAGAAVLLARVFQIELTNVGRRKKRFADESQEGFLQPVFDGKQEATIALLTPLPMGLIHVNLLQRLCIR